MNNDKILKIDFVKLAVLLLPICLRTPTVIALCGVLVRPVVALLSMLSVFRADVLQRLKYNGQVCRLEYCLNYIFGDKDKIDDLDYDRRILVLDCLLPESAPYIIYRRGSEAVYDKPVLRGNYGQVILNRREVNSRSYPNFIVEAHKDEKRNNDELSAVVNIYKTQGKAWELQEIE